MERDEGLSPKGVCDVGIKREGVERDEGLSLKDEEGGAPRTRTRVGNPDDGTQRGSAGDR